jgi:hypothetical protein
LLYSTIQFRKANENTQKLCLQRDVKYCINWEGMKVKNIKNLSSKKGYMPNYNLSAQKSKRK